MARPISIKFPFQRTQEGGVFETNKTTDDAIRTDLVSLLTTKRGHRVMRPGLFSPIFDFLMEPWDEISESELREQLLDKVDQFMAGLIEVKKMIFELQNDGNTLRVEIVYVLLQLGGVTDRVELFVPLAEND